MVELKTPSWRWLLPVLAGAVIALMVVASAQAATNVQLHTASKRVGKAATRGLERYDAQGSHAAAWKVYGTDADGERVVFRYRLTYNTPGRHGDGKVVCRGKVIVRGPADDAHNQHAQLVQDRGSCR